MGYIYRFLNRNGEIIYVGKTEQSSLDNRILTHSHLPVEAYIEKKNIECFKLTSKADLAIYEMYYINKFQPKFNTASKYKGEMQLKLPELQWTEYSREKTATNKNKSEAARNRKISYAQNRIVKFAEEIELLKECEKLVSDMISYFKIKQELITNENVKTFETLLNNEEAEFLIYRFEGTANLLETLVQSLTISLHQIVAIKYKVWIKLVKGANFLRNNNDNNVKCEVTLCLSLAPYLHYTFGNLEKKIETAESKIKLESMKLDEYLK